MIERPFDSILGHDLNGLFEFVSNTEPSEWGISKSGRTATQIAYHTGSGLLTAIVVAVSPVCISEISWTYDELIEALIGEYSQISLCSGWNDEIEYQLWSIVNAEYVFESSDRLDWLSAGVKSSIRKVAVEAGTWVLWDTELSGPKPIPLRQWKMRYSEWKRKNPSKVL